MEGEERREGEREWRWRVTNETCSVLMRAVVHLATLPASMAFNSSSSLTTCFSCARTLLNSGTITIAIIIIIIITWSPTMLTCAFSRKAMKMWQQQQQ